MIHVSRSILISAPKQSVQLYLQELKNVAEYEQKVDAVEVTSREGDTVHAAVSGKFLGLPWKGTFKVRLTGDGGYQAELAQGSIKRMSCSFQLRSVAGGTVLTHSEQYHFSLLAGPIMRLCRGWVAHTIELELGVIKEEAERVNRRLHLAQIENV